MSSPATDLATDTDRAPLMQAATGDPRAVGALYDRFGPMLYAIAARITGERADAEEAVLEAFAQAWRDADRFRQERGSVAAWLTMIVRSRALDLVRSRTRRERATAAAAQDAPDHAPAMGVWETDPAAQVEQDERARRVRAAVDTLSDAQRQAIELAFYEGLSHAEIAARLGEPLGTVKTRVRLGMQKLREALRPLAQDRTS